MIPDPNSSWKCIKGKADERRVANNCEMISRPGVWNNRDDFYVYTIGWVTGMF